MGGTIASTTFYLSVPGAGVAALGLREKQSDAHDLPYDPDGIKLELLHRPTYWASV